MADCPTCAVLQEQLAQAELSLDAARALLEDEQRRRRALEEHLQRVKIGTPPGDPGSKP